MLNKDTSRRAGHHSRILPALVCSFVIWVPYAAADNYLDTLEAEADNTTVLEQAQQEHAKLKQITSQTPVNKMQRKTEQPPAANRNTGTSAVSDIATKEFESGLYREFPGNFAVYSSLSDDQKKQVVTAFIDSDKVSGLTRYGPALALIIQIASQ